MHNIKEHNPERNQNGEPIHRDNGAAGRRSLPEEKKRSGDTNSQEQTTTVQKEEMGDKRNEKYFS